MTREPAPAELIAVSVAGTPWTLLFLVGAILLLVAAAGPDATITITTIAMNVVFITYLLRHLAFATTASRCVEMDLQESGDIRLDYAPDVTVIVACHNEELVAESLVASLLALEYPRSRLEVVLVNDRSSDRTGELLGRLVAGHPHIRVLHRGPEDGGGKSGALNDGVLGARGEIIVIFDADHIPRPDCVRRLVRHFQDPSVGAVQGRCEIRNWGETTLARAVAIDYLSGYMVNEYGRQALFELPAYGGANCAVRAATLRALGGWNPDSVTEDTDLTLRIVLAGGRVRYDVTAVDAEQAPATIGRFCRQRYRWARGHQQVWRDYRSAVRRASHLTLTERLETFLFLLIFHVPVVCLATVGLLLVRIFGIGHPVTVAEVLPLTCLLFAGPFCELAVGLMAGRTARRAAWTLAWMPPLFVVSMVLCSKAWIDGILGRPYSWVKTQRSALNALSTEVAA